MRFFLYYHTIKYLKFRQIYFRVIHKFINRRVTSFPDATVAENINTKWIRQSLGAPKFLSDDTCRFLNQCGKIIKKEDWNCDTKQKLWLYNLHYFDDLLSLDADRRRDLHQIWLDKWISHNPPVNGNGWEPYPTSLRIVNWIKAFLDGFSPKEIWLVSLAQQADYLSKKIEYHLLGNHLFANAKALIFAGTYLECPDAVNWLKKGIQILDAEIDEQILSDGSHFELTPMYHSIILTDLLDIFNIIRTYPSKFPIAFKSKIQSKIPRMLQFLADMSHGDGKLSFFNDTAMGIAADNDIIFSYAEKLGFSKPKVMYNEKRIIDLRNSGYVIAKDQDMSLICDLSPIGPSYLPGHAHADMLSFEISLREQRIFVNSGVSEYEIGEERHRQRKTKSHNTVEINNSDSCEIWGGFRVARRGEIINRQVDASAFEFTAAHTGYIKQGIECLHSRTWKLCQNGLIITDNLKGRFETARGHLHLHPNVNMTHMDERTIVLTDKLSKVVLTFEGAKLSTSDTTWHPEFGLVLPTSKITYDFESSLVKISMSWTLSGDQ